MIEHFKCLHDDPTCKIRYVRASNDCLFGSCFQKVSDRIIHSLADIATFLSSEILIWKPEHKVLPSLRWIIENKPMVLTADRYGLPHYLFSQLFTDKSGLLRTELPSQTGLYPAGFRILDQD